VAFPDKAGRMVGAHAVVAGDSTEYWALTAKSAPTKSLKAGALRVPIAGARAVRDGGRTTLIVSGAAFPNPAKVSLLYAASDKEWSAYHDVRGELTIGGSAGGSIGGGKDPFGAMADAAHLGAGLPHFALAAVLGLSAVAAAGA